MIPWLVGKQVVMETMLVRNLEWKRHRLPCRTQVLFADEFSPMQISERLSV